MKIIVVSDTHGEVDSFISNINTIENIDLIIHLGDYVIDGERIEKETGIKMRMVKGNGDIFSQNYNEEDILDIREKKIFLTHGHSYKVRYKIENLLYRAEEVNADIVLFGHTHIPIILEESGIILMNPGSPSRPRGVKNKKTFGIIEIEQNINTKIIEI